MAGFRIAVVGAGGVGGYFAGALARSGAWVGILARGADLDAIRHAGLAVQTPDGEFVARPACVSADPAGIGPVDAVLVAVKAWQVAEAAGLVRPMLGVASRVLPMQNGIEAASILRLALDRERVLDGVCRIVSERVAPGRIRHVGVQPTVHFGEADGGPLSPAASALRDALRAAGITVHAPVNAREALWEKLHFLASLSAVAAVAGGTVGEMRRDASTRAQLLAAMQEIAAVSKAAGTPLPDEAVARSVSMFENMPPESTLSMQRDMAAGRPSELDAIVGAVFRRARELSVPTPVLDGLYAALLPRERKARAGAGS